MCIYFFFLKIKKGSGVTTRLAYRTEDAQGSRSLKVNKMRRMKAIGVGRSLGEGFGS